MYMGKAGQTNCHQSYHHTRSLECITVKTASMKHSRGRRGTRGSSPWPSDHRLGALLPPRTPLELGKRVSQSFTEFYSVVLPYINIAVDSVLTDDGGRVVVLFLF